jgi:hypothetical protein
LCSIVSDDDAGDGIACDGVASDGVACDGMSGHGMTCNAVVAGHGLACDCMQVMPWTVMVGLLQHCQ